MKRILAIFLCVAAIFPAGCQKKKGTVGKDGTITTVTKLPNGTTVTTVTPEKGRVISRNANGPV